ncbi:MAG TPA: hypothetical protein VN673_09195, partial [Clostridia bacterium]|nr:hypothetical protein [Clostridia bacterium]
SVEQLAELNQQLATMRHDINNYLSLIVAAGDLVKQRPQTAERMLATMAEQPSKITKAMQNFSLHFESTFGITR